jgi:hypothetical protein
VLSCSAGSSHSDHEAAVAAFLRAARERDPERYRRVCDTYPVLVGSALRRRLQAEVLAGDWLASFVGSVGPGFVSRSALPAPAARR